MDGCHVVLGGVMMETIRERSTFSQPRRFIDVDKVCVRFEKRKQNPFIDCTSALKYVLGASNDSADIDSINNITFSC